MDGILVRGPDSPLLLLGSVNSSLPPPSTWYLCIVPIQLVAMATGSRYSLLQDSEHIMPRGKIHSTATVFHSPGLSLPYHIGR